MQTKLFILAVAMIASVSSMTGREAIDNVYDHMTGRGYSIQLTHWRPANCRNEEIIHWGMVGTDANRHCVVCVCDTTVSTNPSVNCDLEPCFQGMAPAAIGRDVRDSWHDSSNLSPWRSGRNATVYQLYKVSDGVCYMTGVLHWNYSLRRMKCFTNRSYSPK